MDRIEYLDTLTEQIHNKYAKEMVRDEITAHIEDQKEAYLLDGKEEKEAEELAVREMGNPVDAGIQLDKVHRPKTDGWMIAGILVLTLAGIVMQIILFSGWDNAYIAENYPVRTVLYNLAGFALIALIYFCDYRLMEKYILPLYLLYFAGSLLVFRVIRSWDQMLLAGQVVNMVFVPLFAATVYYFRGERWKGIVKSFGILLISYLLRLLFGYYVSGMMLISGMACLITILAAAGKGIFGGNGKRQAGILSAIVIGLPALFLGEVLFFDGVHLSLAAYQIRRIQAMINPSAFEMSEGYITCMVRRQLSNAALLGGGQTGEIGQYPGCWSEYVLISITSYFGILAASAVVLLITAFLARSLYVSAKQQNRLGFLLGVSCSSLLIMKTVLYVAMNFGIGPAIGIDMPFLAYGLSNTLANSLLIGLIFSVYRNTNLFPEVKTEKFKIRVEKVKS